MSKKTIEALFLGDICGKPGCRAIFVGLRQIIREQRIDVVIANGENAADGFGITPEEADQCFASGVDVLTSGNHIWQKSELFARMDSDSRILRPANYPPGVPGQGYTVIERAGVSIGVLNLQGRVSMPTTDCPFRVGRELVQQLKKQTKIILVDFHAESAEEKEALGLYLDGQVSVLVGTHTHVQTADERILPKGTGYITDIGMTGAHMSVIGSDPGISIRRQLTQIPLRSEIAEDAAMINGIICSVDIATGRAVSMKRLNIKYGV